MRRPVQTNLMVLTWDWGTSSRLTAGNITPGNTRRSFIMRNIIFGLTLLLILPHPGFAQGVYLAPEDFVAQAFDTAPPKPKFIWFTGDIKKQASAILGHKPGSLRTRYWQQQRRSVWILEEIGKEQPITTGIIVHAGKIERIKVLIFRESRGWEVRRDAFVQQFANATLTKQQQLNKNIDGISGATLSVRALKKLARLALYLDSTLHAKD